MGWRFNPAPGWPTPPAGHVPPAGWQPDVTWPPAPSGWQLWIWVADELPAPPPPRQRAVTPPSPQALPAPPPTAAPNETVVNTVDARPEPTPRRGWRARRAERRREREYAAALADWQTEHNLLEKLAKRAEAVTKGRSLALGVLLKSAEFGLWKGDAALIEPRRQPGRYVGSSSGVSFRVAKGVRLHTGGSRGQYVPGPEVQTPIDMGPVAVTTQRVLFMGSKTTREWAYSELLGVDVDQAPAAKAALLHVANRQKVSGIFAPGLTDDFLAFLALGVAIFRGNPALALQECREAVAEHDDLRPSLTSSV
jgi:hypothetical protein